MTLTSKVGRFIFDDEIRLSQAKIVRDTVTVSVLGGAGITKVRNEQDALSLGQGCCSQGHLLKVVQLV